MYFREHAERGRLIFRILFWNWTLALHFWLEQVLSPTEQVQTMAMVKYKFILLGNVLGVAVIMIAKRPTQTTLFRWRKGWKHVINFVYNIVGSCVRFDWSKSRVFIRLNKKNIGKACSIVFRKITSITELWQNLAEEPCTSTIQQKLKTEKIWFLLLQPERSLLSNSLHFIVYSLIVKIGSLSGADILRLSRMLHCLF